MASASSSSSHGVAVIVVDDTYDELEFHYPRLRLREAGFEVCVAATRKGHNYTSKHGLWGTSTHTFQEIDPKTVKVLIIPGGMCADRLRRSPECCRLVKEIWEAGAVVGFICHGGWLPISAKIVKGCVVTSFFAIRDDLENAGAEWVDQRCVVDGRMVTAQTPEDLPEFMLAILQLLETD